MKESFDAIILAGGLRKSPLHDELGMHELCLPLDDGRTLLAAWLETLGASGGCKDAAIVVSDAEDAQEIQRHLDESADFRHDLPHVQVIVERGRWRGTAGVLRDVADGMVGSEILVAVEAACLPPSSLTPLLASIATGSEGVVGVGSHFDPAGVYGFRRSAMKHVPSVGYFDLKEQLLPEMYTRNASVHAVCVTETVIRLRDREGYLQAISWLVGSEDNGESRHCSSVTTIAPSVRLVGTCLIDSNAKLEDGVIVRDSVVLDGAVVGIGAVVNRSVIGSGAVIAAGHIVTNAVVPCKRDLAHDHGMADSTVSSRTRVMASKS